MKKTRVEVASLIAGGGSPGSSGGTRILQFDPGLPPPAIKEILQLAYQLTEMKPPTAVDSNKQPASRKRHHMPRYHN
jgi:hypothetical protein